MFKILNGYKNIDSNFFFEMKKRKITRGHNFTLVKKQSRWDVSLQPSWVPIKGIPSGG